MEDSGSASRYWLARFALAARSGFPASRLKPEPYASVLSAILLGSWTEIQQSNAETFVVDRTAARTGSSVVTARLAGALDSTPEGVAAVIVDLRTSTSTAVGGKTLPRANALAAQAIARWSRLQGDAPPTVVLVVEHLTDPKRVDLRGLAMLAEAGSVVIVAPDGAFWDREGLRHVPAIAEAFKASLELLQALDAKMIRRLGFFRADEASSTDFSRVYFDGRYCEDELEELFVARVTRLVDDGASRGSERFAVVCAESPSPWLAGPVSRAVVRVREERELTEDDLSAFGADQMEGGTGQCLQSVLLVVAVVEKGAALKQLRARAGQWAKAATFEAQCVVFAGSPSAEGDPPTVRLALGQTMPFKFFLTGKQSTTPRAAFTPDAAYYEAEDPSEDRFLEFTSLDFWEMVLETGCITENDRPEFRSQLKLVPDFVSFLERNGAWVSHKIERAIESLTPYRVDDVALVLVADETGASALADVLASTIGITPMRIPRRAFDQWNEDPNDRTIRGWEGRQESWLTDLRRQKTSAEAFVIVDEFSYSAQTLEQLAGMLQGTSFDVCLILTIAAFSRTRFDEVLEQWPRVALYSTEWRLADSQRWIEVTGSANAGDDS